MIRTSTVAFMLLDPSDIATITATFLIGARQAGSSVWDTELTSDRVITMEEEVARAKSAKESDSKVLIRKVLASSVPTAMPVTQAYWIAGEDASNIGIMCANCNNKRRALGIPALGKETCADSNCTPDLGYDKQSSAHCINCCAIHQGLGYLGHTSNADNPDEKTIYMELLMQQKELAGIFLALMDHGMFDSPLDGRMVSPDIDFVEWMIVVYSAVKGTKTEKDLANWGFIRCPPAVAVQKFLNRKGSSLSVVMGANDYDMNFLVGNDLGNAVYNQWLRHTLSEEQWKRTFDHSQSVNEERAGDAVEVCLATLYLATLFPVEFRFWGDPFENYAGLEHSIRSFAVSAGCLPAVGSQRSPPSAPLSLEVTQMAKRLAAVLGSPAVIANLEEYYATLKRMKDGPLDPTNVVKEEPDDANITGVSAEPGVVDAVPHDSEHDVQDAEAESSPQDDAGHVEQSETEAPVTPISTKKRRIGASLKELMTHADDLRVCPICWVHHADFNCPRSAESEALCTALAHLLEGGAAPVADSQMDPTSTNISSGMAEAGDVDMGVDAQAGDSDDTQRQPTDADLQDVTDVEVEEAATDDAGDEPPTVLPEAKPRAKARPIRKLTSSKMSSDESVEARSVRFLDEEEDVSPLGQSRELESIDISNIQQLKNQFPQFLEYANPRPFHSGRFINSEGEVDWTRGKPPLTGRVCWKAPFDLVEAHLVAW